MVTKIKVKGMHCDACVKLVEMEVEEAGLQDKVGEIKLIDDNMGEITLKEKNEGEISKLRSTIDKMSNYEVV
jgi:copper chaperone CopZ